MTSRLDRYNLDAGGVSQPAPSGGGTFKKILKNAATSTQQYDQAANAGIVDPRTPAEIAAAQAAPRTDQQQNQFMQLGQLPTTASTQAPANAPQGYGGAPTAATQAAYAASRSGQMDNARGLGEAMAVRGGNVYDSQAGTASNFQQLGAGYQTTAPSITGGAQTYGGAPPAPAPRGGSGGFLDPGILNGAPQGGGGGAPAGQPAFNLGYQNQAQQHAGVGNVDPGSLGGVNNVMGQLGGAPGNVAGQLGGGYQVGGVANVAGRLGAAPQVGNVGDIRMGAGPANVAGQLGNLGLSSQNQQGMMGRLEGFLDGPQGPSIAEAQLQQGQADNMASLIGAARSGRGGAGSQAQALRGAISEGGAIASDTMGQMATLRAQEEDMLKNRQLSAIGLGGELGTAMRGQDLAFRGQDLSALQGDQSTQLGTRGQDLSGAMANQSTRTALEGLRAQTALGARGQDLSALQGDQSTGLGLEGLRANTSVATRGQDLSALQGDQSTQLGARGQNLQGLTADQSAQLGMRGQNLSALQGNQATALGTRGQDVTQELGLAGTNATIRGQDINALTSDADRALQAQQLALEGQLGYGRLGNEAMGQGLDFLGRAGDQALTGENIAQNTYNQGANRDVQLTLGNQASDTSRQNTIDQINAQPTFLEQLAVNTAGGAIGGISSAGTKAALASDRAAKVEIADATDADLEELLELFEPQTFEYADPSAHGAGRFFGGMAQDLQQSRLGRTMVVRRPDGFLGVDDARAGMAALAAVAMIHRKLRAAGAV